GCSPTVARTAKGLPVAGPSPFSGRCTLWKPGSCLMGAGFRRLRSAAEERAGGGPFSHSVLSRPAIARCIDTLISRRMARAARQEEDRPHGLRGTAAGRRCHGVPAGVGSVGLYGAAVEHGAGAIPRRVLRAEWVVGVLVCHRSPDRRPDGAAEAVLGRL